MHCTRISTRVYCMLKILTTDTRYDAEWTRRLDGHGCVCEGAAYCPPKGSLMQSFHERSCKTTPRPKGYAAALRAVQRLGAALGVHYRVDMYIWPCRKQVGSAFGQLDAIPGGSCQHQPVMSQADA